MLNILIIILISYVQLVYMPMRTEINFHLYKYRSKIIKNGNLELIYVTSTESKRSAIRSLVIGFIFKANLCCIYHGPC